MTKKKERLLVLIPPPFLEGNCGLPLRGDLPHQVVQLVACLKKLRRFSIDIIDAFVEDMNFINIIDYIKRKKIHNIVIPINTVNREIDCRTVFSLNKAIKQGCQNTKVILVNWFFIKNVMNIITKKDYEIDYILFGDVEETLVKFLTYKRYQNIPGCLYRYKHKYYLNSPATNVMSDLDLLPIPDWNCVNKYSYKIMPHRRKNEKVYIMNISRGCPWNKCVFCQENNKDVYYRVMSPERVLKEIKLVYFKHNIREIQFDNVQFPTNKKWLEKFVYLLKKNNIKIIWSCLSRIDFLDEEKLSLMKEAGCWNILVGIETFDPKLQVFLHKGLDYEKLCEVIKYCKKIGIEVTGSFLMGIPGENPAGVLLNALKAALLGIDYYQNFIVKWYAKSELNISNKLGFLDNNWQYHKYDFYGPRFIPRGYGNEKFLEIIYSLSYLVFYFNPIVIFRYLLKMKNISDIKRLLKSISIIRNIIVK